MLFARAMSAAIFLASAGAAAAQQNDSEAAIRSQWFTGTLLSPSPGVPRQGVLGVEPYLIDKRGIGVFDANGILHSGPVGVEQLRSYTSVNYGFTDALSVQVIPAVAHVSHDGDTQAGLADFPIKIHYRPIAGALDFWHPSLTTTFGITFPTGKFEHLRHAADGFGTGAYTFSAKFNGSTVFASSSSAPVQLNVARASTAISLTASPNPATQNRTISLSANITALLSATVGPGSITFFDGTTLIASAPFGSAGPIPANQLTNTATVTVNSSALAAGTHSITASYAGNNNFLPAVSSPLVVTIKPQDFSIVAADPAITIQTEHHRATRVTLTSVGAFADQLSLRCDNLPAHATCTFDHSALQVLPNGTATANLIIDTDDVLGFKADNCKRNWTQGISFTALLLPAGLLAVSRRRRLFPRLLLLLLATLAVTLPLTGCDGLYPRSTAPGTYTISVIANGVATKLTRSALITLTITK